MNGLEGAEEACTSPLNEPAVTAFNEDDPLLRTSRDPPRTYGTSFVGSSFSGTPLRRVTSFAWPRSSTISIPTEIFTGERDGEIDAGIVDVRLAAQHCLFVTNEYFLLASLCKALAVIPPTFYEEDVPGGWRRFVFLSASMFLTGVLSPLLAQMVQLGLPCEDTGGDRRAVETAAIEEPVDVVMSIEDMDEEPLWTERLLWWFRFDIDSKLHRVFIQCASFSIWGAVVLPASVTFCLPGFLTYAWYFVPVLLIALAARFFYYRNSLKRDADHLLEHSVCDDSDSPTLQRSTRSRWWREVLFAFALRMFWYLILQWVVQSSLINMIRLWDGEGYVAVVRREFFSRTEWDYYIRQVGRRDYQIIVMISAILF
jgi:hypothetical protein